MLDKRVMPLLAGAVLWCFFLSGCGDKTGKIIGHWKSRDGQGGWHSLLVFAKESMTLDEAVSDTAMESRDGKIVVRRAGTDTVLAVVTVVDDDTLEVEADGRKIPYVKSSPEEHAALLAASPKERVLGFWKTPNRMVGGITIMEIGPDFMRHDGREATPLARVMEDGRLVLHINNPGTPGSPPVVTFLDDDHIQIASPWLGQTIYERIASEAARRMLAPEPELVHGHWIAGDHALALTADSMNMDGVSVPVLLQTGHKAVVALDPEDGETVVARFLVGEDGDITLETGPMSRDIRFVRADGEEVTAKLAAYAATAEAVIGVWMSEEPERSGRGGRSVMVIERDSFTRDDRTTPSRIVPLSSGVRIAGLERFGGPLAELTILGPDRLETAGGFMSEKKVYIRTTAETMALLRHPDPEDALGSWVSEADNNWLPHLNAVTLSPSSMVWNGGSTPAALEAEEGAIVVKDDKGGTLARITFMDAGRILLRHASSREPVPFVRADAEEAEAVARAYKEQVDNLSGFWLSEKDGYGYPGGRVRLEFRDGEFAANGEKRQRCQPVFLDGAIHFVDPERAERKLGVVEVADADAIRVRFGMSYDGTFLRSSPEEVDALVNPPPESVYGYWLSEGKNPVDLPIGLLVFTPDAVMVNFDTSPAEYVSGNGRLIAQSPENKEKLVQLRQVRPDRLVMNDNYGTVYLRASQEDFQAALMGYQKEFQDTVMGYWKGEQAGGKRPVLHITRDRAVLNNERRPLENFRIGMVHGQLRLKADGRTSVHIDLLGDGRIRYDYKYSFVRASEEEYNALLEQWR